MGTLALRVTGGTKRYHRDGREQTIFQGVELTVDRGEIFALLGPSGCGKSTLLRAVAGLEPLSAGRVEVGKALEGAAHPGTSRRPVGMVFQEPLLLPWLTVAENVALGLRYRTNRDVARGARAAEAVEQILRDFGLTPVAGVYPQELSGGQAQRASLARTVVTQPSILLLDEPFAALDPRTRAGLQDWLLGVVRRRRLTVLLVTHDVEEALYLGDRVGLRTSSPSTIARIWNAGHADGGADAEGADGTNAAAGGAVRRSRHDERLLAIRREILAQYETEMPSGAAPAWVI